VVRDFDGEVGFARQFNLEPASNRHAGASRHPDCMLVALLLDSGFRRNDESKAASELAGKDGEVQGTIRDLPSLA
jgi:hypothetical protein